MARAVDPKRTRKALKILADLKASANSPEASAAFSEWEDAFITEVSARLEQYGSAFNDFGKGAPEDALSRLQQIKMQELRKKARNAAKSGTEEGGEKVAKGGFRRRKPLSKQTAKTDE
jgi:hypothetical protein